MTNKVIKEARESSSTKLFWWLDLSYSTNHDKYKLEYPELHIPPKTTPTTGSSLFISNSPTASLVGTNCCGFMRNYHAQYIDFFVPLEGPLSSPELIREYLTDLCKVFHFLSYEGNTTLELIQESGIPIPSDIPKRGSSFGHYHGLLANIRQTNTVEGAPACQINNLLYAQFIRAAYLLPNVLIDSEFMSVASPDYKHGVVREVGHYTKLQFLYSIPQLYKLIKDNFNYSILESMALAMKIFGNINTTYYPLAVPFFQLKPRFRKKNFVYTDRRNMMSILDFFNSTKANTYPLGYYKPEDYLKIIKATGKGDFDTVYKLLDEKLNYKSSFNSYSIYDVINSIFAFFGVKYSLTGDINYIKMAINMHKNSKFFYEISEREREKHRKQEMEKASEQYKTLSTIFTNAGSF